MNERAWENNNMVLINSILQDKACSITGAFLGLNWAVNVLSTPLKSLSVVLILSLKTRFLRELRKPDTFKRDNEWTST